MGRPKKDAQPAAEQAAKQVTELILDNTAERYDEAKQKCSDDAMRVAKIMKSFEDVGGNNKAFILVRQINKWEKSKQQDFLRSMHHYLTHYGIYAEADLLDDVPALKPVKAKEFTDAAPSRPSIPMSASAH